MATGPTPQPFISIPASSPGPASSSRCGPHKTRTTRPQRFNEHPRPCPADGPRLWPTPPTLREDSMEESRGTACVNPRATSVGSWVVVESTRPHQSPNGRTTSCVRAIERSDYNGTRRPRHWTSIPPFVMGRTDTDQPRSIANGLGLHATASGEHARRRGDAAVCLVQARTTG